jgi:glycerol-3-phosphate acyltransferase PlsY
MIWRHDREHQPVGAGDHGQDSTSPVVAQRGWPLGADGVFAGISSGAATLAAVAGAFALGCIPSGRLVARAFGVRLDTVGDGKPGAANVRRSIGLAPGLLVLVLDAAKGFGPATVARRRGAGPHLSGALALAPVLGHVLVVKGRGAAPALGAAFAVDAAAMSITGVGIVAGSIVGKHAEAVVAGGLAYPPAIAILRRDPVRFGWGLAVVLILVAARLRGMPGSAWPPTREVLWSRFWRDRDV